MASSGLMLRSINCIILLTELIEIFDRDDLLNEEKQIKDKSIGLSLDPPSIEQQDSADSFIDSPMDNWTPNSLSSLLSASVWIPDNGEKERDKTIKQEISRREKQIEKDNQKCQLSAKANEFVPVLIPHDSPCMRKPLSLIIEDDGEEQDQLF